MSGHSIRLADLARGALVLDIAPDEAERKAIARRLGLIGLPALTAKITVRPWLDGAEIGGRFEAVVTQECGVTLDPFDQEVAGDIDVRVVPPGSPHAPSDPAGELELDPDAPDQPDELAGEEIDLGEYLVEHLALEIDPFPRKPGATFEYENPEGDDSPFAVLKGLQDRKG
ncbi:MAG: DUF177 domain-containing protein [Phenylobacterium sp.]|jgi:hypothetical protein|uniref:YceD family protein n=1 Tax=Phenylobacterium sp. TaxID=1871053 RepID=UPI002A2FA089|nr:DUF177 domain-containing protein [Phenylobacterium sp.]MDD3836787.1 DUF177 domain-containing protein [Phenylobacterium sp.]MDX9999064.1 DUF177 domain-containing protein [Phenylobacterium sp.]